MKYSLNDIPKRYESLRRRVKDETIIYLDNNNSYITLAIKYCRKILVFQSIKGKRGWSCFITEIKQLDAIKKAAQGGIANARQNENC